MHSQLRSDKMPVDFGYSALYNFIHFVVLFYLGFFCVPTALQNVNVSFPSIPNQGKDMRYSFCSVNQKANDKHSARLREKKLCLIQALNFNSPLN